MRRLSLSLVALSLVGQFGCSGDDGKDGSAGAAGALTRVTQASPSATCKGGGLKVEVGPDANGNGVLDDAEVTSTNEVCNGAGALSATTNLPIGDAQCAAGGSRFDIGIDDGAGGGVAADGVLQPGEVRASTLTCAGIDTPTVQSITPPASPAAQFTMNARGGDGVNGGSGGSVYIYKNYGTIGGHIKVFKTGVASPDTTLIATPATVSLGPVAVTVNSNTTVEVNPADPNALANGTLYIGSNILWRARSPGNDEQVTGLTINSGATLTFGVAGSSTNPTFYSYPTVVNAGTITTALQADNHTRLALQMYVQTYIGRPGSVIDLSAVDYDASTAGAPGRALYVYCNGACFNEGTIRTDGGDGSTGGSAGSLELDASYLATERGSLYARGGNALGTTGSAGNGGTVRSSSGYSATVITGIVDASGGDGGQNGGSGGNVNLSASYGRVDSTVVITSDGGDAAPGCATSCTGGSGGTIEIRAEGGDLRHNGALSARGGAGGPGAGGGGGDIDLHSESGSAYNGNASPAGSVYVSGNLDVAAAALPAGGPGGGSGGSGGSIDIYVDADGTPLDQEVVVLGYSLIDVSGASGSANGASGGNVQFYVDSPAYSNSYIGPDGAIVNYVDVRADAGNGGTGSGASGGDIELYAQTNETYARGFEAIFNYGVMSANGGSGPTGAGDGGQITLYSAVRTENRGPLTANGGSATNASASAGSGGDIEVVADYGPGLNTATLTAIGGNSTGADGTAGSGAGYISVFGNPSTNSGSIVANGGNANAVDGNAGDGGFVDLYSPSTLVTNTGAVNVSVGTGFNPGNPGSFQINGILQ